ncbi:MAG: FISUMP domain-containing protein [Bacteroidales bacterium]
MKKYLLCVFFASATSFIFGQKASIDLTFTATSGTQYQQLDSIMISNLNQGADTTLLGNDTVLTITFSVTGIGENMLSRPKILLEYSNSAGSIVVLRVFNPENDNGLLSVFDCMGRECAKVSLDKGRGRYSFRLATGRESLYFVSLLLTSSKETVKLINTGRSTQTTCHLAEFSFTPSGIGHPKSQVLTAFPFSPGDSLRYKGYANNQEVVINDDPTTSENYTFQFPAAAPCQGDTAITYGGQVYHTIEIGTQCVMKENLNIGTYVASISTGFNHSDVDDNGIIEKYCYNNDTANCAIYGGLYDWDEMMQYDTISGTQGICPAGWHVPTHAEWSIFVNSLGGDPVAGGKMKETGFVHWLSPNTGATNQSGFTAFGVGMRNHSGNFFGLNKGADFWSSSQFSATASPGRGLWYTDTYVNQYNGFKTYGLSLRCFKD